MWGVCSASLEEEALIWKLLKLIDFLFSLKFKIVIHLDFNLYKGSWEWHGRLFMLESYNVNFSDRVFQGLGITMDEMMVLCP